MGNWLVSDAFDLEKPRSLEGEQAVRTCEALMQANKPPTKDEVNAADTGLRAAGLPDIDTFWVRWRSFRDQMILESASKAPTKTSSKKKKPT